MFGVLVTTSESMNVINLGVLGQPLAEYTVAACNYFAKRIPDL